MHLESSNESVVRSEDAAVPHDHESGQHVHAQRQPVAQPSFLFEAFPTAVFQLQLLT